MRKNLRISRAEIIGGAVLLLIIGITLMSHAADNNGEIVLAKLWDDFYANIASEVGSIIITVFFIDRLQREREKRNDMLKDLLRALRSNDAGRIQSAKDELVEEGFFTDGSLGGAVLPTANLQGLVVERARLYNINLDYAILDADGGAAAQLKQADLRNASFVGAKLSDADLRSARLDGAELRDAELRGTILFNASFKNADLSKADLSRARLRIDDSDPESVDFSGAIFTETTYLPDGTLWDIDDEASSQERLKAVGGHWAANNPPRSGNEYA